MTRRFIFLSCLICFFAISSTFGCCSNCTGSDIECSDQEITIVQKGELPQNTTNLDLSDNQIISFNDLHGVHELELLERLNLSGNSIGRVGNGINGPGFENWTQLENLDLSKNQIVGIAKNVWQNVTKLKKLNLRSNNLRSISSESFKHLTSLEWLDLSDNPIYTINIGNIQSGLKFFRISSTSLICDCNLYNFKIWYTSNDLITKATINANQNICRCPLVIFNRTLVNISTKDMACSAHRISICINATWVTKGSLNDYRVHYNQQVNDAQTPPISVQTIPTELGCVVECQHTKDCFRVSYSRPNNVCRLFPFSMYDNDTSTGTDVEWNYCRFVPKPENLIGP